MMQIEMIRIFHPFVANTRGFLVLETSLLRAPAMPDSAFSETVPPTKLHMWDGADLL